MAEYQKIADRAVTLVEAQSAADAPAVAEMRQLAEKAVQVIHTKLTLTQQPTLQQAARYNEIGAQFQKALHAVCPSCPRQR